MREIDWREMYASVFMLARALFFLSLCRSFASAFLCMCRIGIWTRIVLEVDSHRVCNTRVTRRRVRWFVMRQIVLSYRDCARIVGSNSHPPHCCDETRHCCTVDTRDSWNWPTRRRHSNEYRCHTRRHQNEENEERLRGRERMMITRMRNQMILKDLAQVGSIGMSWLSKRLIIREAKLVRGLNWTNLIDSKRDAGAS